MITNLTPHTLNLFDLGGNPVAEIPPSGEIARVKALREQIGDYERVPLFTTIFGEVDGLPAPKPNTIYVVSGLVRAAVPSRGDVFSPGELVRDDGGKVIGAKGLTR